MTHFAIAIAVPVIVMIWVAAMYNRLVRGQNLVKEGWSDIDVQLKRRADLIPNLVETVTGYVKHERGLLEKVTELRAKSLRAEQVGEKAQVAGQLSAALAQLLAVAENYPDLKASQNFSELQAALNQIEDHIQLARRFYNGAARELNILIASFPSNLVATWFKFMPVEYFEIEEPGERAVPKVSFA